MVYSPEKWTEDKVKSVRSRIPLKDLYQIREIKINEIGATGEQMSISKLINAKIGLLYLLTDYDKRMAKIGKTESLGNLHERFRTHQCGSPSRLDIQRIIINSDYHKLDKELRSKFKRFLSHGEWYKYNDEIEKYFNEHGFDINWRNSYFEKKVEVTVDLGF